MANYEIWLTSDSGIRLAALDTFTALSASQTVNGIGWFSLTLPTTFDPDLVAPDRIIQIWREPSGGRLGLWRPYFLRKWTFTREGSKEYILLEGPDVNDLLRRRIVAAYAGSAQATQTDFADDMMKAVVTQSIADGVAPTPDAGTRVWSDLSIETDFGLGPTITQSFAFDTLLKSSSQGVLPQIGKNAKELGTEVFFGIYPLVVSSNSITFQFQTKINQPGQDVSNNVVFSEEAGNMKNPRLEYDYSEEINYVYGGGQGEEADRNIQQVYDTTRYSVSQWNRCEGFADARNQADDNGVIAAGNSDLNDGRPRIRFTADPIDTQISRFGIDWDFGYTVRTKYKNVEFNSIIRAVTVTLDDKGYETISARLDFESVIS